MLRNTFNAGAKSIKPGHKTRWEEFRAHDMRFAKKNVCFTTTSPKLICQSDFHVLLGVDLPRRKCYQMLGVKPRCFVNFYLFVKFDPSQHLILRFGTIWVQIFWDTLTVGNDPSKNLEMKIQCRPLVEISLAGPLWLPSSQKNCIRIEWSRDTLRIN
jgi:hypothetical protein